MKQRTIFVLILAMALTACGGGVPPVAAPAEAFFQQAPPPAVEQQAESPILLPPPTEIVADMAASGGCMPGEILQSYGCVTATPSLVPMQQQEVGQTQFNPTPQLFATAAPTQEDCLGGARCEVYLEF